MMCNNTRDCDVDYINTKIIAFIVFLLSIFLSYIFRLLDYCWVIHQAIFLKTTMPTLQKRLLDQAIRKAIPNYMPSLI